MNDGALAILINESDTDDEGKDDLIDEENFIRMIEEDDDHIDQPLIPQRNQIIAKSPLKIRPYSAKVGFIKNLNSAKNKDK